MPKGIYPRQPGLERPGRQRRRTLTCPNCTSNFTASLSNTRRKYCKLECYNQHNRGENNPTFKGGHLSANGYRLLSRGKNKKVYVHKELAESLLGRKLETYEVVHHIDGNKLNNSPANLLVTTVSEHQRIHAEMSMKYAALFGLNGISFNGTLLKNTAARSYEKVAGSK